MTPFDPFLLCRALLRQILGKYLPQIPSQLNFSYGSYGKPSLLQSSQNDLLCFNRSHSKDIVLYVLSRDPNIGIDLKYLREDFNHEEVVQRFFSEEEKNRFQHLSFYERMEHFFAIWTCKAAYLKARGTGLSDALEEFELLVDIFTSEVSFKGRGTCRNEVDCKVHVMRPWSGYVAAVVLPSGLNRFNYWQWVSEQ